MKTVPFTPGPLRPSPRALHGLANPPATHHREQPFIDMMTQTQGMLCDLLGAREHFAVVMTCTGTGANESVLRALHALPGRGLILNNGYFAERLISQAMATGVRFDIATFPTDKPLTAESLGEAAAQHGADPSAWEWVYVVAHETRAGLRNDAQGIARAARMEGLLVACDGISATFAYPFDPMPFDFLVASSAKGVNSVAGLGIVFCRGVTAEKMLGAGRMLYTHYLDLLGEYQKQRYDHRPLFAQSIPLHAALHGACLHLVEIGMEVHWARIQSQMARVVSGMGYDQLVLDPQYCAFVVTNFRLPPSRTYPEFARCMAARGYFLLCGIPDDDTHFQVSTMGSVTDEEVVGLVTALHTELGV